MTAIRWTWSARRDLRDIHAYVSRDSKVYAQRLVDRIKASVERLRRFPKSGAMVPEWEQEDLREVIVGNYRAPWMTAMISTPSLRNRQAGRARTRLGGGVGVTVAGSQEQQRALGAPTSTGAPSAS
ncbi:MAG: type II toxin-antitoxin system RelE/ParE family toxin [Planctomycetes bacterium]|nr:type II toxin-antitoxin system RelE/ParE family toxin [Planctomycetota bacterium]